MAKLKKFNKNENGNLKKKIIIGIYAFLIIGIILTGASYAVYQQEAEGTFINARVGAFKVNDIELAIKLDGKEVDAPPSKNNYTVTVDCDNATGTWDMNEWGPNIRNITAGKVKCEVNFVTPQPTLTNITATSTQTSIILGYTAGGIGTTTTCKYGTDKNYGSTVSGATNTNCNITGLTADKTYYYKVCAKNATGEVCKDGNIKTKPIVLADNVELGDYISMTPTATTYSISKDLTGYSSNQTIKPSELNLWRVIRKNEDGTVDVVSQYVSTVKIYFKGKTGYKNFVGALNTIAAQYTNTKYVQSTRHVGFQNQTETITDLNFDFGQYAWNRPGSECSLESCITYESQGAGDFDGYKDDYNVMKSISSIIQGKNKNKANSEYWMSTRRFGSADSGSVNTLTYSGAIFTTGETISYKELVKMASNVGIPSEGSYNASVRPILTLKSNISIVSGDGKSDSTAYSFE